MDPQNEVVPKPQIKRCQFYVSRKKRTCKFEAVANSKFCAAHGADQQQKIQCPYQKGFYISASKYQKHLLNCPKVKNQKMQEENNWFNKGVNLEKDGKEQNLNNYSSVTGIDPQALIIVIGKIVKLFLQNFGEEGISLIKSTQEQKIENLTNDHTQAYLLAEAALNANLIKDDLIYIQFGAGKGILSYHIAEKVKSVFKKHSKNVLLERETRRNKFDRFMKDNHYFQRYKSDVSDFDVKEMCVTMVDKAMEKKPNLEREKQIAELNDMAVIGICKHMCGGALDISVRALLKTKMTGCLLASCCHHLCSYDTYLNNKFFQDEGFTPEEINIMFKISSWGTRTSTVKEADIDFEFLGKITHENLQGINKIIIGRICKRLIDLGRSKILNCQVVRYCSDQITPQNFVIISK